jgi:hypothetical protein
MSSFLEELLRLLVDFLNGKINLLFKDYSKKGLLRYERSKCSELSSTSFLMATGQYPLFEGECMAESSCISMRTEPCLDESAVTAIGLDLHTGITELSISVVFFSGLLLAAISRWGRYVPGLVLSTP